MAESVTVLPCTTLACGGVMVISPTGIFVTVKETVSAASSTRAVMRAVPMDSPVALPLALTLAIVGVRLVQVTTRPVTFWPSESSSWALRLARQRETERSGAGTQARWPPSSPRDRSQ